MPVALEPPLFDQVEEALKDVIDPELGVNIVDLGLVYEVTVGDEGDVAIRMTLTTPGCPLGGYLEDESNGCLRRFPPVRAVSVDLVWDPPWQPAAMTDAAKRQLGWRG
jgi:metal-sulfur cluster biosynthetic enzyme